MKISALIQDPRRSQALATARAQRVVANVNQTLRWPAFFTRTSSQSMKLTKSTNSTFQFVAERRPYDTRGIEMPEKVGALTEMIHLPIQVRKTYGEEDVIALGLPVSAEAAALEALGLTFDDTLDRLARADALRVEFDALRAWHSGDILAKNFATKVTALVSFGVDAARYETASTAWDDAGVNAWNEFVAWARLWSGELGGLGGAYMSGADLEVIRADAPVNTQTGLPLGNDDLGNLVGSQIGGAFRFVTDDRRFDVSDATPDDIATTTSKQRVWPIGKVAAIPAGNVPIGTVEFVPVTRAGDLAAQVPEAKIQRDDVTIIYVTNDDGTSLEVQAQLNAYPDLDHASIAVMNTGVTA